MALWSHIKLWLIISVFTIFLVMAMSRPDQVYNAVQNDISAMRTVFGDESTNLIIQRTNSAFEMMFGNVAPAAQHMHVSDDSKSGIFGWDRKLSNQSNQMIRSAKIELYHLMLRVQIFVNWLPMIIMVCFAGTFDGLMARKVKIASFRYTNPALYNSAGHTAIFLLGSSLLILHLPIAISIWFWPITGILIAIAMMVAAMNMQRMSL